MTTRRDLLKRGAALAGSSALLAAISPPASAQSGHQHAAPAPARAAPPPNGAIPSARTEPPLVPADGRSYRPVVTPNGGSLRWRLIDGVKEFRLTAEPVKREFAPG